MNFIIQTNEKTQDVFNLEHLDLISNSWRTIFPTDLLEIHQDYFKISLYYKQNNFKTCSIELVEKYLNFGTVLIGLENLENKLNELSLNNIELYYIRDDKIYNINHIPIIDPIFVLIKFTKITNELSFMELNNKTLSLIENNNNNFDILETKDIMNFSDLLSNSISFSETCIGDHVFSSYGNLRMNINTHNEYGKYLREYFNINDLIFYSNFEYKIENDEVVFETKSNGYIEIYIKNLERFKIRFIILKT